MSVLEEISLKKQLFLKLIFQIPKVKIIFLIKKFDFVFHFAALINNEESLKYLKNTLKIITKKENFFFNVVLNNLTNIIYFFNNCCGNRLKKVIENDLLNPISLFQI